MKHVKTFLAILLVCSVLFCTFVRGQEIFELKQLPKSQPIIIDGYSNELIWEDSVFIKADLPRRSPSFSKYAIFRVLGDVNYLYVQVYVMDNDRAVANGMPDGVRIRMKQDRDVREYAVAYNGITLSDAGETDFLSAGDDNDIYYSLEIKIPFQRQWKNSGEFSLDISVIDNGLNSAGYVVSDVSDFSYLFRVNMESPTTTTTKVTTVPTTKPTNTTTKRGETTKPTQPAKTTTTKPTTQGRDPVITSTTVPKTEVKYPVTTNEYYGYEDWTYPEQTLEPESEGTTEFVPGAIEQPGISGSTQMETLPRNDTELVGQKLQTKQKGTEATQAFGTIIAGLLLFFGVFLLFRLKKGKDTQDKK